MLQVTHSAGSCYWLLLGIQIGIAICLYLFSPPHFYFFWREWEESSNQLPLVFFLSSQNIIPFLFGPPPHSSFNAYYFVYAFMLFLIHCLFCGCSVMFTVEVLVNFESLALEEGVEWQLRERRNWLHRQNILPLKKTVFSVLGILFSNLQKMALRLPALT